jgi:hypothetical protein
LQRTQQTFHTQTRRGKPNDRPPSNKISTKRKRKFQQVSESDSERKEKLKDIKKRNGKPGLKSNRSRWRKMILTKDYALLKKLKKKKITEEEFEAEGRSRP